AKDYVSKRPVAVMINNIKEALPSSSTKQADVIYECMVEGGITRLLAVFSDYDQLEKIGSVRSSRHYYINIANEYDAIYVCYGQSKPAKSMLDSGAINVVNGYTYGPAFYRDTARVAPHNAYTTGERLVAAIEDFGYASTYSDEHKSVFSFNEEETELENAETANVIHINYSNYSKPYLNYDKENKVYERYEYDAPQIDNQAPEGENVLTFKNVIVMISHYECINAENDLQDLKQTGQGQGYYCTDGKAIPITWKKESDKAITKYYTENGEELKLNPGKTWISIIGDSANAGVSFE
ncbi:MAG: DUF3048 domain-containing protein, partial [Eubacteriales bacterium]|nr:DUF3048 domain-containing protein [Eubacteriales bacterium]